MIDKNRVSIHDRKRNLSNFCQSIVYYDNQRKMDRLKNLQQARKNSFTNTVMILKIENMPKIYYNIHKQVRFRGTCGSLW